MFGFAMFIFSLTAFLLLDKIYAVVVLGDKGRTYGVLCFLVALVIGFLSEIGLRLVAK